MSVQTIPGNTHHARSTECRVGPPGVTIRKVELRKPRKFVVPIEPPGARAQEPFHPGDRVGLRCFYHQKKMIAHQAAGVDLPFGLEAGFGEDIQKCSAVSVVLEIRLATVTPVRHTVNGTRIFDSESANHEGNLSSDHNLSIPPLQNCRICGTEPLVVADP